MWDEKGEEGKGIPHTAQSNFKHAHAELETLSRGHLPAVQPKGLLASRSWNPEMHTLQFWPVTYGLHMQTPLVELHTLDRLPAVAQPQGRQLDTKDACGEALL